MGHPRAGNHLLATMLHAALVPMLPGITIRNRGTGHWTQRTKAAEYRSPSGASRSDVIDIPYYAVLGTHDFPRSRQRVPIVYIMRDGRDVALSFYRWPNLRHVAQAELSLTEFLRAPIDWRGTPGRRWQQKPGYTLFDHWRDHVNAWAATGAILVRYELLVADPQAAVARVAKRLDLRQTRQIDLPAAVGWNPSSGRPRVGAWREEMPTEALRLFDEKVPRDHVGRWPMRAARAK